jgi:hypothetical protein
MFAFKQPNQSRYIWICVSCFKLQTFYDVIYSTIIWTSLIYLAITTLSFDNHLPEDDHSRPKHIGRVSYIYKLLYFHCCAVVGINICKHNQQDSTLHNGIYYYKCSTCFRRFLRPSSGAQNCIQSIGYLSRFSCRKSSTNTRCSVYSFQLLMMGGGTAWNM